MNTALRRSSAWRRLQSFNTFTVFASRVMVRLSASLLGVEVTVSHPSWTIWTDIPRVFKARRIEWLDSPEGRTPV